MNFLEQFRQVQALRRKRDVLRARMIRLVDVGGSDSMFESVSDAFDRADDRYGAALADLTPVAGV
jgi:hypothetical protein